VCVVRQVLADPAVPLADLDLVTEDPLPGRTAPTRGLAAAGPRRNILDVVSDVVSSCADSRAIVSSDNVLTYAQVGAAVEEVASGLRSSGVRPGDIVQVRAGRSAALPIALLGCWRSGVAPALVDATLPTARLASCGRVLGASLILAADGRTPTVLNAALPPVRALSGARPAGDVSADQPSGLPGTGLSHVLFTSGTTGSPAAVCVPHGPLRDFIGWYVDSFGIGSDDRFAMLSGPGHDPVLRDMFVPFSVGATLHVPPDECMSDPEKLLNWLAQSETTVLHTTPAQLELIIAGQAEGGQADLEALRLVVVSGAILSHGLLRRARPIFRCEIVNAYGTTETPQIIACARFGPSDCPDPDAPDESGLPIGSGVAGHRLSVQTPRGRLAGVGQRGELVVYSRNLCDGYLGAENRADGLTIDPESGVRSFRTGDLGRFDRAGQIHLDGRADRQVSVNGNRLELGEVEVAAQAHPSVRQALALMSDTPLGLALTLQVTRHPGQSLDPADLRSYLRARLPAHAVPSSVTLADELRLGPTHKIEQRVHSARDADTKTAEGSPSSDRPPGAITDQIGDELNRLLGRPVGLEENFFDAGLNSITLLQLHALTTRTLGLTFPATAMFTHPTLGALIRYLENGEQEPRYRPSRGPGRDDSAQRVRYTAQARRELRHRIQDGEAQ
jgi:amino acid adenylation domain-containing protein